jgi:hypothetical protein
MLLPGLRKKVKMICHRLGKFGTDLKGPKSPIDTEVHLGYNFFITTASHGWDSGKEGYETPRIFDSVDSCGFFDG